MTLKHRHGCISSKHTNRSPLQPAIARTNFPQRPIYPTIVISQARHNSRLPIERSLPQLQRSIGNRAVARLFGKTESDHRVRNRGIESMMASAVPAIQRAGKYVTISGHFKKAIKKDAALLGYVPEKVKSADLSVVTANDELIIDGAHGDADSFGHYGAKQLAKRLVKQGLTEVGYIELRGCETGQVFSLALRQALEKKNVAISGGIDAPLTAGTNAKNTGAQTAYREEAVVKIEEYERQIKDLSRQLNNTWEKQLSNTGEEAAERAKEMMNLRKRRKDLKAELETFQDDPANEERSPAHQRRELRNSLVRVRDDLEIARKAQDVPNVVRLESEELGLLVTLGFGRKYDPERSSPWNRV